jgi:hypothetical protein
MGVLSLFLSVFAMLLLFLEQQTAGVYLFWDEFIGIIDFGIIILESVFL